MEPRPPSRVPRGAWSALVLSVAALLALGRSIADLREGGWSEARGQVSSLDEAVSGLGLALRPGEPIGVVIPPFSPDREAAYRFAAQYALTPALVQPVRLRDCLLGQRCHLDDAVSRVAVIQTDAGTVALLERQLALTTIARAGSSVVLGKSGR